MVLSIIKVITNGENNVAFMMVLYHFYNLTKFALKVFVLFLFLIER